MLDVLPSLPLGGSIAFSKVSARKPEDEAEVQRPLSCGMFLLARDEVRGFRWSVS